LSGCVEPTESHAAVVMFLGPQVAVDGSQPFVGRLRGPFREVGALEKA